jgi:hypothetical protein
MNYHSKNPFPTPEQTENIVLVAIESPEFFNALFTDVDLGNLHPGGADGVEKMIMVHDLISERVISLRQSGYRTRPAEFSTEDEAAKLGRFDAIIAIQWDEGERIRRMVPGSNVLVVPVSMPLVDRRGEGAPENCLFVGSGSLTNVDGLAWFLKEVWPLVVRERPSAVLNVYGSVCSRISDPGTNVVLHGVVDSLHAAYAEPQVAIAPLRAGSGLKVKLVEAPTHCMPTVTTSVGAQGLGHLQDDSFIVAGKPPAMARAIADLFASNSKRAEPLRRHAKQALVHGSKLHMHRSLRRYTTATQSASVAARADRPAYRTFLADRVHSTKKSADWLRTRA